MARGVHHAELQRRMWLELVPDVAELFSARWIDDPHPPGVGLWGPLSTCRPLAGEIAWRGRTRTKRVETHPADGFEIGTLVAHEQLVAREGHGERSGIRGNERWRGKLPRHPVGQSNDEHSGIGGRRPSVYVSECGESTPDCGRKLARNNVHRGPRNQTSG